MILYKVIHVSIFLICVCVCVLGKVISARKTNYLCSAFGEDGTEEKKIGVHVNMYYNC